MPHCSLLVSGWLVRVFSKVTACTFNGPHLDQLFISTSPEGLEPGADPLAGSLFRVVVGVTGLPVREFAG